MRPFLICIKLVMVCGLVDSSLPSIRFLPELNKQLQSQLRYRQADHGVFTELKYD